MKRNIWKPNKWFYITGIGITLYELFLGEMRSFPSVNWFDKFFFDGMLIPDWQFVGTMIVSGFTIAYVVNVIINKFKR